MKRIVSRILLISCDVMPGTDSLRRRVLRFTGSRRATRAILQRIEEERQRGPLLTCMVSPNPATSGSDYGDEPGWLVSVSFATMPAPPGHPA